MESRNLVFDTWEKFLTYVKEDKGDYFARSSQKEGNAQFSGSDSFAQALELAHKWPEGTALCQRMAEDIAAKASVHVERMAFEFATHDGNAFDIGRFLRGEPECVLKMVRKQGEGKAHKVVKLAMNVAASWSVDQEVLIRRGAALCAAAYCLHRAGYGTEIWAALALNDFGTTHFQVSVLIKRANAHFDLGRLAFACAHPSMLRRFMFAALENQGKEFHAVLGHCYGRPTNLTGIKSDVCIERALGSESHWQSSEACVEWVLATLKTQGVVLK